MKPEMFDLENLRKPANVLEAILMAYEHGIEKGREDEHEAVIAFLNREIERCESAGLYKDADTLLGVAEPVFLGDHRGERHG